METSVPATSRVTPSVRRHTEVLGSILVQVLEPGSGGIMGSIFLRGPSVSSRYRDPRARQEDLNTTEEE